MHVGPDYDNGIKMEITINPDAQDTVSLFFNFPFRAIALYSIASLRLDLRLGKLQES